MDNIEKILAMLEQMQGDIAEIKEDLAEVKEDSAITRSATNSLVKWADNVSVITQIKFPVDNVVNK